MTETADSLRKRANELAEAGARVFDGPALGYALALIDRAEAIDGDAGAQLLARAQQRLGQLEQHFLDERATAEEYADGLVGSGVDRYRVEELLERGDFGAIRRASRAQTALGSRKRPPRIVPTVDARRIPRKPRGADALRAARERAAKRAREGIPTARYRNRRAVLSTALRLAQTHRELPEVHGPYNGQTVALELLEVLAKLSPVYAHTILERTRELGALAALPSTAPPPKPERPRGRRRRR